MQDESGLKAMHEELDQFQKSDVWKLVKLPKDQKAIGAKFISRNKIDINNNVVRG